MAHGRSGRPWRRLVQRMRNNQAPCWLCGGEIDYEAPWWTPWSFTVDHKIPLSVAPWLAEDPTNLRAAHRRCNTSKGARTPQRLRTSRQW